MAEASSETDALLHKTIWTDRISKAINRKKHARAAEKTEERLLRGWDEVHLELKAIPRSLLTKSLTKRKIFEKLTRGWQKVHEELQRMPFCSIRGHLTRVFLCMEDEEHCEGSGKCVACSWPSHHLVSEDEAWELERCHVRNLFLSQEEELLSWDLDYLERNHAEGELDKFHSH